MKTSRVGTVAGIQQVQKAMVWILSNISVKCCTWSNYRITTHKMQKMRIFCINTRNFVCTFYYPKN